MPTKAHERRRGRKATRPPAPDPSRASLSAGFLAAGLLLLLAPTAAPAGAGGASLAAQEIAVPDSTRVVAVRAGRLFDGTGTGLREDVTILVRGDRIAAVGPDVQVPDAAEIVDLSDLTLLPGLLDLHTHITGDPSGGFSDHRLHEWPGYASLVGVKNARKTLLAGFTTVRNVGADEWASVALRQAVDDGLVPGPRIYTAAHSLGITGGHCDLNGYRPDALEESGLEQGMANSADGFREAVHYQIKYGADLIKFCATGGVLSQGDAVGVQQLTLEQMTALVEAAHMADVRVAAHAHGLEGIKTALRAGVNTIEHGSMLDEESIRLFRETGAWHVPTMMAFDWVTEGAREGRLTPHSARKALEIAPHFEESIRRSIQGGVKIAFGTDAGVFPHGRNAGEFALLVDAGMSPADALTAATGDAAEALGQSDRLGTVEAGKMADLVAVRGNPLDDVTVLEEVDWVIKDGVVYKRDGRPVAHPGPR